MIARELYHVHQTTFDENVGRKELERRVPRYAVCCLGSSKQGAEKCVRIARAKPPGTRAPLFGFSPANPRNPLRVDGNEGRGISSIL